MAKPKEERNKQFIKAWKEEGLSDKELQERFNLSEGGVKGLKARLRKKDPSLYIKKKPKSLTKKESSKVTSTSTQTSTSTKRMTFWLEERMIERIKRIARNQKRTASDVLREILGKYLKSI